MVKLLQQDKYHDALTANEQRIYRRIHTKINDDTLDSTDLLDLQIISHALTGKFTESTYENKILIQKLGQFRSKMESYIEQLDKTNKVYKINLDDFRSFHTEELKRLKDEQGVNIRPPNMLLASQGDIAEANKEFSILTKQLKRELQRKEIEVAKNKKVLADAKVQMERIKNVAAEAMSLDMKKQENVSKLENILAKTSYDGQVKLFSSKDLFENVYRIEYDKIIKTIERRKAETQDEEIKLVNLKLQLKDMREAEAH